MTEFNKAWVAMIGAILVIIDQTLGINIGPVSNAWVTEAVAIATAILVWAVPNKGASS